MCAILGFVCKVLKKRGKVLKMCVSSLKKTVDQLITYADDLHVQYASLYSG